MHLYSFLSAWKHFYILIKCFIKYLQENVNIFFKGFLPRDTAKHHRQCVLEVLRSALSEANITPQEIDAVSYTKGTYMKLNL